MSEIDEMQEFNAAVSSVSNSEVPERVKRNEVTEVNALE